MPAAKSVDEPLTEAEVKRIKEHLRFLRDHRKLLKLKVNANEDLLLNGKREPTRGAVQHLLAKVDYSQVLAVTSRIPAGERPAFVAGLLRFKTELAYVLLYLESLKDSAHEGASGALESALEHIDFGEISAGQMGRLLDLIATLFDDAERAVLLLSLLESRTFRVAFDVSVTQLPAGLAGLVAPLGALHRALHPRPDEPPPVAAEVEAGVYLLLRAGMPGFTRRPRAVQVRLVELSLRAARNTLTEHAPCIERMLDALDDDVTLFQTLAFDYIVRLVQAGHDKRAVSRLKSFTSRFDGHEPARDLSRALGVPRVGRVARLSAKLGDQGGQQLESGFDLAAMQHVWLRVGQAEVLAEHASGVSRLALPRVARVLRVEQTGERAHLVIERLGNARLSEVERPPTRAHTLMMARQLCEIASCLALAGARLPDLAPSRFELDAAGTPTLMDLWGCEFGAPEDCLQCHLELAKTQIVQLRVLSAGECDRVREVESFSDLVEVLTASSALGGDPQRTRSRRRRRKRKPVSKKASD